MTAYEVSACLVGSERCIRESFIEQGLGTEPENVRYSRQGSWVLTGNMRKEEN